ncbi:MAG: CotH kinase family protein, partial [Bacteroidota bacterium]
YHGVYMLTERIKWDDNRVNITRLWPDVSSEPDISGGYIINYDRDVHFRSTHSRNTGFALVRPQTEDITPQQRAWIAAYVGGLESALFGPDFDNPDRGYAAWLEPESFIDHHLITEALKEMDGFRLSTFMHKDRGRRLVMGPVWDFNLSMGNHNPAEGWGGDSPSGWYHRNLSEQQYLNGWYRRLFMDPDFEERYHTRWWELRHGPFATEHVVGMIRQYVTLLDEAQRRNFVRWPILGEDVWHYSRAGLPTYEAEIDALIDFLENRFRWIDSVIPSPKAPPGPQLQYFWLFDDRLPNDIPLETVDASYALTNRARLHFHSALAGYPFDEDDARWRKASMERRNRPTELNYRPTANMGRAYEPATMRALQVRQPFQGNGRENTIIFELPTTSLSDVVFRFAALTEGAASELVIDYSVIRNEDGVRLWTVDSLPGAHYVLHEDYDLYEVDFGDINLVNDNEDFAIRIRFDGDNMTADEGMRVTFSNFSLEAVTISERTAGRPNGPDDRPRSFELRQNYPNPFSSETTISYELPGIRAVRLDIFDLLGRRLATLVDEDGAPGLHEVTFDATDLASGPYLYRLSSDDGSITRMMTVTR